MIIELTGNPELAEDTGETGDDVALAALLAREEAEEPEQGEEEPTPEVEEGEEEEAETPEEEPPEDDDPEIDLGDLKLKKSELKAGYMKDADYRRKTAEVAEAKRQTQALAEQVAAERVERANHLDVFLESLHRELVGDQEALAELARTDPAEWVAQNAVFQQRAIKFQQAVQQRQSLQSRIDKETEAKQAEWQKEQRDLLHQKLPEWSDKTKAASEQKIIAEYALKQGYSAEDLAGLFDHRALLVLRDAALHDAQKAARETAKAKQVKPEPSKGIKPGAAPQKTQDQAKTKLDDLRERARRTNRQEDIAAYLIAKSG